MTKDLGELLEQYMDQEKLTRLEGRRGVEALCQIAGALGYKDPQYYGQLTRKATLGDLIMLLEDNSGLVQAMIEWLGDQRNPEWADTLVSQLPDHKESAEDDEDSDN